MPSLQVRGGQEEVLGEAQVRVENKGKEGILLHALLPLQETRE